MRSLHFGLALAAATALIAPALAIGPSVVISAPDSARRPYTAGERVLLTTFGTLVGAVLGLQHDKRGFVCGDGARCAGDVLESVIVGGAFGATLGAPAGPCGAGCYCPSP